jgi:DNA-binding transcriptional LysR family regulator
MQNDGSPTWDDLRVLLALHRHRSFLAAGRALGVSTSTAARRIEALESSLGRPLVHRSSSGTSVEPAALDLIDLAEQLELGLRAVRRDEGKHAISGAVRISMGEGFIQPATRVLCELRRAYPTLQLEVISESRNVDLARREADVGIRKSRSASPAVIERDVGRLGFGLYAAESYVERRLRGAHLAVADIPRHDYVGHDGAPASHPSTGWLAARGATRFVFRSNSDFAMLEATLQGQGIAVLADAAVRGGLVRIHVDAALPTMPVFLAFHRELRQVPRVRVVIDALTTALRAGLR